MSEQINLFAVIPHEQLHRNMISCKSYIYSTRTLQTDRNEDWALKTKKIGILAAELNRGALLSTDLIYLEQLCMKYGGIVQDIRTGEVMAMRRNGYALQNWTARTKPFFHDTIAIYAGFCNIDKHQIRIEVRTDGHTTMNFVSHMTDLPEVINLLGRHHYIP